MHWAGLPDGHTRATVVEATTAGDLTPAPSVDGEPNPLAALLTANAHAAVPVARRPLTDYQAIATDAIATDAIATDAIATDAAVTATNLGAEGDTMTFVGIGDTLITISGHVVSQIAELLEHCEALLRWGIKTMPLRYGGVVQMARARSVKTASSRRPGSVSRPRS